MPFSDDSGYSEGSDSDRSDRDDNDDIGYPGSDRSFKEKQYPIAIQKIRHMGDKASLN